MYPNQHRGVSRRSGDGVRYWPFVGFHAAGMAVLKMSATPCAFRRDPLVRGPDEKRVWVMVSARSAVIFVKNGCPRRLALRRCAQISVQVMRAMQSAA